MNAENDVSFCLSLSCVQLCAIGNPMFICVGISCCMLMLEICVVTTSDLSLVLSRIGFMLNDCMIEHAVD